MFVSRKNENALSGNYLVPITVQGLTLPTYSSKAIFEKSVNADGF